MFNWKVIGEICPVDRGPGGQKGPNLVGGQSEIVPRFFIILFSAAVVIGIKNTRQSTTSNRWFLHLLLYIIIQFIIVIILFLFSIFSILRRSSRRSNKLVSVIITIITIILCTRLWGKVANGTISTICERTQSNRNKL
jgi:protein-S-isoprenylcysteine O-methyltransferase Ste14